MVQTTPAPFLLSRTYFCIMRWVVVACFFGIMLSSFAVYVEQQKALDPNYEALCDIGVKVSCSKVFSSAQGKILSYWGLVPKDSALDMPNAIFGAGFYFAILFMELVFKRSSVFGTTLMFFASLFGGIFSAYLAYVLMYELEDLCLICTGTYVCTATILFVTWRRHRALGHVSKGKAQ